MLQHLFSDLLIIPTTMTTCRLICIVKFQVNLRRVETLLQDQWGKQRSTVAICRVGEIFVSNEDLGKTRTRPNLALDL